MLVLRFAHVFFGALWVGMMAFQTPSSRWYRAFGCSSGSRVLAAAGLLRTPMGLAFGSGGAAALLAFLLGIVVMRPAMMRSAALGASLPSASPEERAKISAELQRLRARGAMTGWVVMILLLYALGAMAVARYL